MINELPKGIRYIWVFLVMVLLAYILTMINIYREHMDTLEFIAKMKGDGATYGGPIMVFYGKIWRGTPYILINAGNIIFISVVIGGLIYKLRWGYNLYLLLISHISLGLILNLVMINNIPFNAYGYLSPEFAQFMTCVISAIGLIVLAINLIMLKRYK